MRMERVGVVGGGLMGSGIAEVAARGGCDVAVLEVNDDAAKGARQRVEQSVNAGVRHDKLKPEEAEALLGRIRIETDRGILSDRELVVEAVPEVSAIKIETFAMLDEIVERDDAILASNTSSIPVTKMAMATSRPERVLGLHFFNPVPVMKLVELVRTLRTTPETVDQATEFCESVLGKTVIESQDRAGFVVNALLVPYLLSAIRMYARGYASAEDIDIGMQEGCNHPMGPLALCDLVGLDTVNLVAESLFEEFRERHYAPPPLLMRMVEAGHLGRKTGKGFYDYPS